MPTLEARELTCFAAGKTREELYRDGALYASPAIEQRARELLERHLKGEPVAYLIGEWEQVDQRAQGQQEIADGK